MIVFYADDGFTLNLTNTKITFVEENPIFFDYFLRNYTWPFSVTIDDYTSKNIGFLDLENSYNYKTKYYGKLQVDTTFDEAYLLISNYKDNTIEGTIYYGKFTFTLLDKNLSNLPFPVITTTGLANHAQEVITKQYPEVDYNFPMVINESFSETSKYEKFEGIINQYVNGAFVSNSNEVENNETVAYNRNLLVPFPYIKAILKTGFGSENIKMVGSFASDNLVDKLMLYTDKYLEKFYSGLPEGFQFSKVTEVWLDGVVSANFTKSYSITQTGSYFIRLFFNLPSDAVVNEFKIEQNGTTIFSSTYNYINDIVILNVEDSGSLAPINFTLQLRKNTSNPSNGIGDITTYNNVSFGFSDGQLNIFPDNFSLSEIMPDMTFGKFLEVLKNWLNLEITFDKDVVNINYIEQKFLEFDFKDESDFEDLKPKREFNQNKAYQLTSGTDVLYVTKDGLANNLEDFREEDINKIDCGIEKMPISGLNGVFTAKTTEDASDLQFLIYNGLKNNLPVAINTALDRTYTLQEAYQRYWQKWLSYRLKSEIFTDKFSADILESFSISNGRFKYNKKHLYRKVKRTRKSETIWDIEIESEALP